MTDDIISLLREIQRDAVLMWDENQTIDQAADEIERLRKELRDLQIAYAKDTDEVEKELTVTKFQLAYWREIALEKQ